MAKPELGSKHKCQNCGTKFFDLGKDPAVCPKCGEVQAAAMPSARAATRAAPVASRNTNDDEDEAEAGPEVMSLEDADQPEDGQVAAAGTDDEGDVETDDDSSNDDDDTFLEEEEDDDGNVSDLIDGDIESDEER